MIGSRTTRLTGGEVHRASVRSSVRGDGVMSQVQQMRLP